MRLLLALLCCSLSTLGQTRKPTAYSLESGFYLPLFGELPFWQRANQYGIVPRTEAGFQPVTTVRSGLRVDYYGKPTTKLDSLRASRRQVDWGWGVDLVLNSSDLNRQVRLLVPEAYAKVRYRHLEFYAGRRRELIGLVDSTLSSGAYSWSGNALPPLKIQFSTMGWAPVGRFLAINALYAQGWFEYDRFIKGSMLHQKAFYLRVGKPNGRLNLTGGFNHQVQWGGNNETLPGQFIRNSQLPAAFSDYVDLVLGNSLNERQLDTTKYSPFDAGNRIGNHLGTVDLSLTLRLTRLEVSLYRQSIFDDGSLFYLTNIADGLNGLSFHDPRPPGNGFRLGTLLLECLNTFSQGGPFFVDSDPQRRGRDNYFNHGQYRDGWSTHGRTIGTPFIAPASDLPTTLPGAPFTNNNRVRVYHLGLAGQLKEGIEFTAKLSMSENAGTYDVPFAPVLRQFSGFIGVSTRTAWLGGMLLTTTAAYDRGDLYANNLGVFVSLKKQGLIKSRFTR